MTDRSTYAYIIRMIFKMLKPYSKEKVQNKKTVKSATAVLLSLIFFSGCGRAVQNPDYSFAETTINETSFTYTGNDIEEYLFTENEKEKINSSVLAVLKEIKSVITVESSDAVANAILFSDDQRSKIVKTLGKKGVTATSDNTDTENSQLIEKFFDNYQNNKECMLTVYEVYKEGTVSAITFLHRNEKTQSYYISVNMTESNSPVISENLIQDIDFINLTEKGYFIYAYKNVMPKAGLCRYFRVKPLPDECRKLTAKYLINLDYQKYNLLLTDWDSENISQILMPGLFEDFYFIQFGKNYEGPDDSIPAELFEEIMTTFLPVSINQLRHTYEYNQEKDTYCSPTAFNYPYAPFPEVVDYTYNSDGTITLYADAVWIDYKSDCAFTDVIMIEPINDTQFRILSVNVEKKELDIPTVPGTKS